MQSPFRSPILRVAPFLAAALALAVLASGCGGGSSSSSAVSIPAVPGADAVPAKNAPPIDLTDQHGKKVDLAS